MVRDAGGARSVASVAPAPTMPMVLLLLVACCGVGVMGASGAVQDVPRLVSAGPGGAPGDGPSGNPAVDGAGRAVVFTSLASSLTEEPSDPACAQDHPILEATNCGEVFLFDAGSGSLRMITRAFDGGGADGSSMAGASISRDGSVVVFVSHASNLVPDDQNRIPDVFAWHAADGTIVRVSVSSEGEEAWPTAGTDCSGGCGTPSVSANARFVVFDSWSENLVPGEENWVADVFRHDLYTGETILVSRSVEGTPGDGPSWAKDSRYVSDDGMRVAFQSRSTNFDARSQEACRGMQGGACFQVYLKDLETAELVLVSMTHDGGPPDGESFLPSLSGDGRWVAFSSHAENLVPDDRNSVSDVFLKDLHTGELTLVSRDERGRQLPGPSWFPSISGDGSRIAFSTMIQEVPTLYVYDHGLKTAVSLAEMLGLEGFSGQGRLSEDGSWVVFSADHARQGETSRQVFLFELPRGLYVTDSDRSRASALGSLLPGLVLLSVLGALRHLERGPARRAT